MRGDQLLQLARADVLSLPDDDVLPPAGDAEVALRIDRPEVPGAEPAVGGECLVVERRVAVAEEAFGPARQYLALAPGADVGSVLVDEPDLVRPDRAAVAVDATVGRVLGPRRRHGRELGRAVNALRDAAEPRRGLADECRVDVGAAAREQPEAPDVVRGEPWVVREIAEERRRADHVRDP